MWIIFLKKWAWKNGLPCKPLKKHILDLWEINLRLGRAGAVCACPPCLPKSETGCGCQWRVSVYLDRWRVQPVLLSFVMNELMGDNAHKGNSHRSPLPFSKCLSQPPVHGKFTNRLLPPYWKRWSLYGRLIMRIEYLSDKLWLEVTPCIVPMMPGSALRVGGIGAAPDYGEVVSKSFLLAHRPDWWLVGLCAFSFWKLLIGLMNWKDIHKPMTTQLCPYCGKPLEEGIFRSRGGNYYLPKDESAPFLYSKQAMIKKGAIQLLPDFVSSAPQWPLAYVCRNCKKIILPYE